MDIRGTKYIEYRYKNGSGHATVRCSKEVKPFCKEVPADTFGLIYERSGQISVHMWIRPYIEKCRGAWHVYISTLSHNRMNPDKVKEFSGAEDSDYVHKLFGKLNVIHKDYAELQAEELEWREYTLNEFFDNFREKL